MDCAPGTQTLVISQLTRKRGTALHLSSRGELADGGRLCNEPRRKLKLHSGVNS
jgi:hypothetical protein